MATAEISIRNLLVSIGRIISEMKIQIKQSEHKLLRPIGDLIRRANNDIALRRRAIIVVVYRPIDPGMRDDKASACACSGGFPRR